MRKYLPKLFITAFIAIAIYSFVSLVIKIQHGGKREDYTTLRFDSLRVTVSRYNTRRTLTVYDTAIINKFIRQSYKCTPIAMEKFGSTAIYSFTFMGERKVNLDLQLVPDGRIILMDLNSFFTDDKVFKGEPMKEFIDYANNLKMKKLY